MSNHFDESVKQNTNEYFTLSLKSSIGLPTKPTYWLILPIGRMNNNIRSTSVLSNITDNNLVFGLSESESDSDVGEHNINLQKLHQYAHNTGKLPTR